MTEEDEEIGIVRAASIYKGLMRIQAEVQPGHKEMPLEEHERIVGLVTIAFVEDTKNSNHITCNNSMVGRFYPRIFLENAKDIVLKDMAMGFIENLAEHISMVIKKESESNTN